jgi:drug/metabolite transporter (DMT)-like permease
VTPVVVSERSHLAIPALIGAMVLWGGTYVITRWALEGAGPFSVLWLRLTIAAIVLIPFARRQGFVFRHVFDLRLIAFGVTGMILHLGFEIVGLRFTSASSAALVIATAPAVTAAFSIAFLGERLTPARWAGIGASIVGVVLVTGGMETGGYPLGWLGNLLVFGGVVMWAVYTVQGKKVSLHLPAIVTTTSATISAALFALPLAGAEVALSGAPSFDTTSVAAVVYLGVFASAGAYGLWNHAIRHVEASVASPFINLVPVLGVGFALLLGETLSGVQILGGVVVAAGIYGSHLMEGRAARRAGMPTAAA